MHRDLLTTVILAVIGIASLGYLTSLAVRADDPTTAAAYGTLAATAAAAWLGLLQLAHSWIAHADRREAVRLELRGEAWSVRRKFDVWIREGRELPTLQSPRGWASWVAQLNYDGMEARLQMILRLSAELGHSDAKAGADAYTHFLDAADRVNLITRQGPDIKDARGGPTFSDALIDRMQNLRHQAEAELRRTIAALQVLAPRRDSEPPLPPADT